MIEIYISLSIKNKSYINIVFQEFNIDMSQINVFYGHILYFIINFMA